MPAPDYQVRKYRTSTRDPNAAPFIPGRIGDLLVSSADGSVYRYTGLAGAPWQALVGAIVGTPVGAQSGSAMRSWIDMQIPSAVPLAQPALVRYAGPDCVIRHASFAVSGTLLVGSAEVILEKNGVEIADSTHTFTVAMGADPTAQVNPTDGGGSLITLTSGDTVKAKVKSGANTAAIPIHVQLSCAIL